MKSNESAIAKQVVAQLAGMLLERKIGQQPVAQLMPNVWLNSIQCTFCFIRSVYRTLGKKVKFDLPSRLIVRNLFGNNTPQASNQFRLITAQTEGLLVSGGLK